MGKTNAPAAPGRKGQRWHSRLLLLLWKNLLLRKRHWVLTLFEILLPTLLFLLLVIIRVLPDSAFTPSFINKTTVFKPASEVNLREMFCNSSGGFFIPPVVEVDDAIITSLEMEGFIPPVGMDDFIPPEGIGNFIPPTGLCWYPSISFYGERKLLWGPPNAFTQDLIERVRVDLNIYEHDLLNVTSNEELNDMVDTLYLQSNESFASFYVGIFFHLDDPSSDQTPLHLNYDLRMQDYWFTDLVFPYLQMPGPRNRSLSYLGSYAAGGFSLLQSLVDRHYTGVMVQEMGYARTVQLETQMYPYPPYVQDNAMSQFYGSSLPTFVVLSLVLLSPTLIKSIVYEKETGVRELVRLMGLEGWLVWLGWFLHSFVMIIFIVSIMTFFLKVEVTPADDNGLLPPILIYSDPFLMWILLLLYGVSSIAFCFAISCFFSKPTLATTLGILIWFLSYFIPRGIMEGDYDNMGLTPKIISCLLPNMAITWGFRVIGMFEGRAVGIKWDNLWETGNPRDELAPAMILLMLCVDILLYFLITWYFDQVMPGKYGVPQSWLFPFQASYWRPIKPSVHSEARDRRDSRRSTSARREQLNFEQEPSDMVAGISITNLRKEFPALEGKVKVAVEDVSLSCYEGQCTVLLGHNGAGKTTTMSVITGVYTASGGSAEIQGYDINTHLKEARAQVGLCPQHNTLFTDLSVQEHLLFFAQLKGLSRSEAKRDAKEMLQKMQLTSKKAQYGNQLSGGMKRKLCLCIALIGGSRVVILDEPSSGLDPESRRWVWDMVQRERGARTVLVTTHHMEEADVLGDKIAIMASGRIVCSGSTLFLKKRFGDGYSLRVLPQKGCVVPAVTSTIQAELPGTVLSSTTEEELIYSLTSNTSRFPSLLESLSARKKFLKINHIGISLTSMEQVFLKVGETLDPADRHTTEGERDEGRGEGEDGSDEGQTCNGDLPLRGKSTGSNGVFGQLPSAAYDDSRYLFNSQSNVSGQLSGCALLLQRLKSLLIKRMIYSKRKWVLLLTQGLVPVMVTLLCLFVDAAFFGESAAEPPRELSLSMFEWTQSFVQAGRGVNDTAMCYQDQFDPPSYKVSATDDVVATLVQTGVDDVFHYRENDVTSAIFTAAGRQTVTRMMYQSIPYHAPGVGMNLISNALLQCAAEQADLEDTPSITTSNYPLPLDQRYRLEDGATSSSSFLYSMMMPIALAFLSASFLVFPLQERVSKAKQIQVMTGTPAWVLWLTTFSWDMLLYLLSALLMFACFLILDSQGFFTLPGAPGALFLLLLIYGWSSLPLAHLFSYMFSTAASGFAIFALLNIVTGMIISVATWALQSSAQPSLMILSAVLGNVSSFIPSYPASKGFKNLIDTGTYNTQCDIVDPSLVDSLCEALFVTDIYSPFKPCCPECQLDSNMTCFEPMSYLRLESPGMGTQLVWMTIDGVLFILMILAIEAGLCDSFRTLYWRAVRAVWRTTSSDTYTVPDDDDVIEETRMAHCLMAEGNPDAALVVDGLTKVFPGVGLTAVNNVSFRVATGECFGLLGVNGAGKTTTFRMLTGDEVPTSGDARIGSTFLSKGKSKFVKEIGYCPQFDAILDELTGEEMLTLLAGLRGVPSASRRHMVKEFVRLVDLTECHKRQTSTYSGGNKRKLSTAMALIGGPPLVFLDEPTTGVDPASRRRVWEAIRTARANGQSIILTSHSMDECEALCSRLVILVRGQLRCAGTPAHLKAKFSQGYSLQVKLRCDPCDEPEVEGGFDVAVAKLQQLLYHSLPGCVLTDQHRGMLSYLVPPNMTWSQLFSVMEELKEGNTETHGLVEDYAATDPSLEQVFLAFAREADHPSPHTEEPVLVTQL